MCTLIHNCVPYVRHQDLLVISVCAARYYFQSIINTNIWETSKQVREGYVRIEADSVQATKYWNIVWIRAVSERASYTNTMKGSKKYEKSIFSASNNCSKKLLKANHQQFRANGVYRAHLLQKTLKTTTSNLSRAQQVYTSRVLGYHFSVSIHWGTSE